MFEEWATIVVDGETDDRFKAGYILWELRCDSNSVVDIDVVFYLYSVGMMMIEGVAWVKGMLGRSGDGDGDGEKEEWIGECRVYGFHWFKFSMPFDNSVTDL